MSDKQAFQGNINFNAQHSPIGAFMSFTLGHFGTGGGIGVEIGKPASQNIFIGVKDGDRSSASPVRCLPFFRTAATASATEFLVEQAGPAEQNVSPNVVPFAAEQVDRFYHWATDRWVAGNLEFSVYSPFAGIPDPACASFDDLRNTLLPALIAEMVIDNSAGTSPKTAVFAIGFDTPGVRLIEGMNGAMAFSLHDRVGFAGQLADGGELISLQRWDIAEAMRDANPVHQLGTCAGFAFEIPPGERRTLRLAIGCYLEGKATSGIEGKYFYTRYFSSLADVLSHALNEEQFVSRRSAAKALDRQLRASALSSDQQFLIAHGTRSYYGSTQLLDVAGAPFWVVNEGEYCMMNTLDLSIDQAFWELDQNPWVVRNLLENFVQRYSYIDQCGISFSHDMGAHNHFSSRGQSSYELPHLTGCFSFMTQEQLCNWVLLAACYVAKTGDLDWLEQNRATLGACAASMRARAHPQTGLMLHDSDRCQGGWEITTYDSLDASLGQARANTYLAVKCWTAWVGLEMLQQLGSVSADSQDILATQLAEHLLSSVNSNGILPAVLERSSPGFNSRILPAVEALIYPAYWLESLAERSAAPEVQSKLKQWLRHPMTTMLRQHTALLLGDPEQQNLFADGGIRLSSTSDNSWMSKIALFQHVARHVLHLHNDSQINHLLTRADAAHVRWQIDGSGYWACSDQFVNGIARGSRYYPRLITAALWMKETPSPKIEVTVKAKSQASPSGVAV